jgi:hypothetical protein
MNPQDLIRSIMTALDNISSDEQPAQGTPEKMNVPTIAVLTPVKVDNKSAEGSKSLFTNVPAHAKQEEPEQSDCGCGNDDNQPDELEIMRRSAGISTRPEDIKSPA